MSVVHVAIECTACIGLYLHNIYAPLGHGLYMYCIYYVVMVTTGFIFLNIHLVKIQHNWCMSAIHLLMFGSLFVVPSSLPAVRKYLKIDPSQAGVYLHIYTSLVLAMVYTYNVHVCTTRSL